MPSPTEEKLDAVAGKLDDVIVLLKKVLEHLYDIRLHAHYLHMVNLRMHGEVGERLTASD